MKTTNKYHDPDTLNAAFKAMRRWGLIARQSFMCCNGCAGSAIADELKDKVTAGKDVSGVRGTCFYTKQDAKDRDEGRPFYLAFGPVEVCGLDKPMTIGGTTEEVGNTVCEILDKFQIPFEWNGDGATKIKVLPAKEW